MKQKITAMFVWGAAAVLSLTACSKDTPDLGADKGEGSFRISAVSAPMMNEVTTRAGQVSLTQFGVPAEKLTEAWIMANMRTRVAYVEDEKNAVERSSANDYNRENPRLSPVPAIYNVTMSSTKLLPHYTDPTGGDQNAYDAPKYRHEHPADKLVPQIEEGEGPDFVYFEGWTEFELTAKENKDVEVTVRVANTVVSVEFTEAFLNYFGEGAKVTLTTKKGTTVEAAAYAAGEKPAAAKYFWVRPQEFTLSAKATRQSPSPGLFDAEERDLGNYTVSAPAPQTWYRCVYDVTNVGGTSTGEHGGITVTVNDEPVYTEILDDEEMNPSLNAPEA